MSMRSMKCSMSWMRGALHIFAPSSCVSGAADALARHARRVERRAAPGIARIVAARRRDLADEASAAPLHQRCHRLANLFYCHLVPIVMRPMRDESDANYVLTVALRLLQA